MTDWCECKLMNKNDDMSNYSPYKLDLRVTRTHKLLSQALFELLSKAPFEKITVKDICSKAMVSRAGFYNHFEDKYHLLLFCMEELKEQVNQKIDFTQKDFIIENVLQLIYDNGRMFKSLFEQETNNEVRKMFDTVFSEEVQLFLKEQQALHPEKTEISIPMLASFLSGGIIHLIQWWVDEEYQTAIPELRALISKSFEVYLK